MASTNAARLAVGDVLEVTIEKVAHGGHFIARHSGAVIFVRHAIPGERCQITITSTGASFNRGDVIEVLEPAPDRMSASCIYANRAGCGGCDFQHISIARQCQLKSDVITEAFLRIAKMKIEVEVEQVGGPLHWRTRTITTTTKDGRLGFYGARSHNVVPIKDCLIAVENMDMPELAARKWKGDLRVEVAVSSTGERNIALAPTRGTDKARLTEGHQILHEEVGGKTLEVSQSSFWQSHFKAPEILTQVVLNFARVQSGDHVLDLYGGVGLFSAVMIDAVGFDGSIELIEGSKIAAADAKRNFESSSCLSESPASPPSPKNRGFIVNPLGGSNSSIKSHISATSRTFFSCATIIREKRTPSFFASLILPSTVSNCSGVGKR